MNRISAFRLAAVVAALACSSAAFADSATLNVTANITGTCKMQTLTTMAFALDPTSSANGTATTTAQYKCTKGTPAGTFQVGSQTNGATGYAGTLTHNTVTTETIPFTINWTTPTAFTGDGLGSTAAANSVALNGSILNANYVNKQAGLYNGSVSVTISP